MTMPRAMPPMVARILLSVFLVPVAALFYTFAVVWSGRITRYEYPWGFLFAGAVTWVLLAFGLFLLWRSRVSWTQRRMSLSVTLAIAAVLVAAIVGAIGSAVDPGFGYFLASALAPALWLLAIPFIWRDTPAEFVQRFAPTTKPILCPTCHYNLTGLTEARCPECGASFTLDQLFAAQSESMPQQLRT